MDGMGHEAKQLFGRVKKGFEIFPLSLFSVFVVFGWLQNLYSSSEFLDPLTREKMEGGEVWKEVGPPIEFHGFNAN